MFHATESLRARRSRFGIKQKMLLVLIGVLVFTIALVASLASYYTNRQNQEAAFADLGNDLRAWQDDLQACTAQIRKAALAIAGDEGGLEQLNQMLTIELQVDALEKERQSATIERTLSYTKAVSLNRLYLMLRTGAFSSIAVYTGGRLSHYVSASEAGMSVRWDMGPAVWIRTPLGPLADRPFENWPSWEETHPPAGVALSMPELEVPSVTNTFPTPDAAAIDVAVPLQAVVQHFAYTLPVHPTQQLVSGLRVGQGATMPKDTALEESPRTLVVLVFRKLVDRGVLRALATKTGKWPVLLSLDGEHRQELTDFRLFSAELLQKIRGEGGARDPSSRIVYSTVGTGHGSFYVALSSWRYEGQPRLMLGFALSREKTEQNVQQTVEAILIVAAAILLISIAIGMYWVKRVTDPIIALTGAVNGIVGPHSLADGEGHHPMQLRPIDVRAPDEIGDLANAFNTMVAELRRSFETLEQRVRARTEELRRQARYFRTLIDTIPLWVSLKDPNGRYLAANEPLAKFCGLKSADEMIGKTDAEIRPGLESRSAVGDDVEIMSRKKRETEILQIDSGAGPVWVERFRAPVMDEDGRVLGLVRVTRDITVQKAAEAAREMALAEAVRLARLRSEFLARLSHELRTPLNGILGYAQVLQQDSSLTDRQAQRIAVIKSSGEHLLNLINDILDLARIDAGRLELMPTELDLCEFLRAVTNIIRVKAREKGVAFQCDFPALAGAVRVDAKRLRQVLLNLLSNAVKFTDRGEIALRVCALSMAANESSGNTVLLHFEVQDSGIGMTAEQMARIFQPFEQVGDSRRREGGAGLGLAISQQLVQLMGGRIRVESQPGRGSLFAFELQLPIAVAAASAAEKRVVGFAGRRRSILVVDDVAINRSVLVEMLSSLGFEVFEAGTGQEALDALQRRRVDLILMDIVMPIMDGLEATRRIRGSGEFARVPIIAVSASATPEEATRSYEAGVNGFLAKPVAQAALLQAIGEQLELTWVYEERSFGDEGAGELVGSGGRGDE